MATPMDKTICEINTQSNTIISSKIQTSLYGQKERQNKDILRKPIIQYCIKALLTLEQDCIPHANQL